MRLHGNAIPAASDFASHAAGSRTAGHPLQGRERQPAATTASLCSSAAWERRNVTVDIRSRQRGDLARHDEDRPGANRSASERPARWLTVSMLALGVLAAAAAAVSYSAQYRMVFAAKAAAPVAALEAAIPDVAALIFATLGIAMALHGKRAIRARTMNLGAVATSITMNVLAAGHGWRDLAIWAMPPVAYALASDTAIGVVRAWTIARQKALDEALADDAGTPLAIVGGILLWILRLALAPASTLSGFRDWVLDECPVAPGRRSRAAVPTSRPQMPPVSRSAIGQRMAGQPGPRARRETKTARFLAIVAERHGQLADLPLDEVSRISTELAPAANLDRGAARAALRRHVLSARSGSRQ